MMRLFIRLGLMKILMHLKRGPYVSLGNLYVPQEELHGKRKLIGK